MPVLMTSPSFGSRVRSLAVNLALAVFCLILPLLLVELVLALFVDVTDNIDYQHLPGAGLHLKPHQEGVYVRAGGGGGEPIRARFHANNAGFNHIRDYEEAKPPGRYRVAVVGDSFVEALQVDYEESFFHYLEEHLKAAGLEAEVLAFGVSGNGTSQAYHLIDGYVLRYAPDVVVHIWIPNDLADSSPYQGRSDRSPQYDLDDDGELVALPYPPYELSGSRALVRRVHLMRFLAYQHHVKARLITLRQGGGQAPPPAAAAASAGPSEAETRAWTVVEKLLQKIDQRLSTAGVPWLLMWQGAADPSFHPGPRANLMAIAERHEFWHLDPSDDFMAARTDKTPSFRIRGDGHWNRAGHEVVGRVLAREVLAALEGAAAE